MSTTSTPTFSLNGKTAIVTGAGRGIGKAIAIAFAAAGANVVVADIIEETGAKTAAEIRESIQDLVEGAVVKWGQLDIAANNAAVLPRFIPISEMDEDDWNRVISVNLIGVAFCLKWETQQMICQGFGGSIIKISSSITTKPMANLAAYSAAKHGVVELTKMAALDNAKHKIRVNAVGPGATVTDMKGPVTDAMQMTDKALGKIFGVMNRLAEPFEIAQAVLWLALDSSSFITGAVVGADGGYGLV